jgi:nicotinate-nucleotide adenylyltransferase
MNKIGIMGGSFDPIHIAHLIIAEKFYSQMNLDKVILIPTYISPFKVDNTETQTERKHRIKMLQLVIEDNPIFELDLFEIENEDISYTYKTIEYLSKKYTDSRLFLLIGADNAKSFMKWKKWEELIKMVTLTIAARPGYDNLDKTIEDLAQFGNQPQILNTPNLEISSSMIRSDIKNNHSCRYSLQEKVYNYIISNNLYLD